jgi:dTDP-4-amino-4,6-dideoxygalactose transaminase
MPALNGIPAGLPQWPVFAADERAAVNRVLESGRVNYWTGNETRLFEQEFADFVGVPHALALANGTVALELALHAFGIGPGDEVITTPRTFIASASAAVLRGARPVLADVDRDSGNITAATIARVLTPRTRAIIVVHLAGWPCEMDPIMELARQHDLIVIEDCAQAHGAQYRGRMVGSIGHAGAFSFCQDKIMTTAGEGGMLVLQDEAAWKRAWAFRDHGKDHDKVHGVAAEPGFRWLHDSFGTNWRLSEVQSAVGRLQLQKLPDWLAGRRRNAGLFRKALQHNPNLRIPQLPAHSTPACYKFYAYLEPGKLGPGWDRLRIMRELTTWGVPVFSGSCSEIYLEKAFATLDGPAQPVLPVAQELGETSLMFLVHPTLEARHIRLMSGIINDVLHSALRKDLPWQEPPPHSPVVVR